MEIGTTIKSFNCQQDNFTQKACGLTRNHCLLTLNSVAVSNVSARESVQKPQFNFIFFIVLMS